MSIKISRLNGEAIHDYRITVILNQGKAIEITVDMGIKSWQTTAGVNIPATGLLNQTELARVQHAVDIAHQLMRGIIAIVPADYEFKPMVR